MQNSSVEDTYFRRNLLNLNGYLIDLSKPKVMGILNITDDSFYDKSRILSKKQLISRAQSMLEDGATFLDIGGYSTRPGSIEISIEEEIDRVCGAIETIITEFPEVHISIDTFRSKVAESAIRSGAQLINDISGFNFDPEIIDVAKKNRTPYILMHLRGDLETMHNSYTYSSIVKEVNQYFSEKIDFLASKGIQDIILDPGFGFSKNIAQNYSLLEHLENLQIANRPLLIGVSRKSMIYKKLNITPEESLAGTIAINAIALTKGAKILRVHDVKEASQLIDLLN